MNLERIQALHAQREQIFAAEDWFQALQQRGLDSFASSGFPSTRQEHWKYTSTKGLQSLTLRPAERRASPKDIDALLLGDAAQATLVFVNGAYRADLSRGEVETGLEALSFREGLHVIQHLCGSVSAVLRDLMQNPIGHSRR